MVPQGRRTLEENLVRKDNTGWYENYLGIHSSTGSNKKKKGEK